MVNLLSWCHENVLLLKANGFSFASGLAHIPQDAVYDDIPYTIAPFAHRNDIPIEHRKSSLISFFSPDDELFPRLDRIEEDIHVLKEYGGICGFDMSPCISMLRPRQRMSLLISSLYNCRCALAGIKIVPNVRMGDLGTMHLVSSSLPECAVIATGELGCRQSSFRGYGLYQLNRIIQEHRPKTVLVYGGFSSADAAQCAGNIYPRFVVYPDRRSRMRNFARPYQLMFDSNRYAKVPFGINDNQGGAA